MDADPRDALPASVCEALDGWAAGPWRLESVRARSQSGIAVVRSGDRLAIVKLLDAAVRVRDPAEDAVHEARALEHLAGHASELAFDLPTLLFRLEDPPALAMTVLPGEALDDGLPKRLRRLWGTVSARALAGRFRALGAALRGLAAVSPYDGAPDRVAALVEQAQRGAVVAGERGIEGTDELAQRLTAAAARLAGGVSSNHGDAGAWNVLVPPSGDRLGIIDWERYGRGPLLGDVALMVALLDRLVAVSQARPEAVRVLQDALLDGFGAVSAADAAAWDDLRFVVALHLAAGQARTDIPRDLQDASTRRMLDRLAAGDTPRPRGSGA